jgi:hypothetical protein
MSSLIRVLLGIDFVSTYIHRRLLFNMLIGNDVTETQALPKAYENHVIKDLIVGEDGEDVYKKVKMIENIRYQNTTHSNNTSSGNTLTQIIFPQ